MLFGFVGGSWCWRSFSFFHLGDSYSSELWNVQKFRLRIQVFQWPVYQRGEVWALNIFASQACSQAKLCQFSEKSYGDWDPVDSRAARTFTAFAYIEIMRLLFTSPKSGYGKNCINRNSRFRMLFINAICTVQTYRIIFHFKVIVACMTLKQW